MKGIEQQAHPIEVLSRQVIVSDREIGSSDWLVVCFVGHVPVGGNGTTRRWTNGHLQTTPESVQSHQHDFPSRKLLCVLNADICVFLIFSSKHLYIQFKLHLGKLMVLHVLTAYCNVCKFKMDCKDRFYTALFCYKPLIIIILQP